MYTITNHNTGETVQTDQLYPTLLTFYKVDTEVFLNEATEAGSGGWLFVTNSGQVLTVQYNEAN